MNLLPIVLYLLTHFTDVIGLVRQFLALIHGLPHDQKAAVIQKLSDAKAQGDKEAVKQIMQDACSASPCPQ